MNRRSFLRGMGAAVAAPWVITSAGVLMPVRQIVSAAPPMMLTEAALERVVLELMPPGSCAFAHILQPGVKRYFDGAYQALIEQPVEWRDLYKDA